MSLMMSEGKFVGRDEIASVPTPPGTASWHPVPHTEVINGYGLIDDCTRGRDGAVQVNGVLLRRNDPAYEARRDDCFRRASYLAKTNTKGNAPEGQRELFSSRIPQK